jgi:hypothetical protein
MGSGWITLEMAVTSVRSWGAVMSRIKPDPPRQPFLFLVPARPHEEDTAAITGHRQVAGYRVGQLIGWQGRPHRVLAFRSRRWIAVERCDPREGDLLVYLVRAEDLQQGAVRAVGPRAKRC